MGANVNEHLDWLLPSLLSRSHTTWVRGFVPASEFLSGNRSFKTDPGLLAVKAAARAGRKVILTIKWDMKSRKGSPWRVPLPGSLKERQCFHFADQLLAATAGELSILCPVNETFVDTPHQDLLPGPNGQIAMVRFLQRLVNHISRSKPKDSDGKPLPIYVGGFTRLDKKRMQKQPATRALIRWINTDPRIKGADFHLHQPDLASSKRALDFLRAAIPSKPFIVTEFSLIWKWKSHLGDAIGEDAAGKAFAHRYGLDPAMSVAQYCTRAFRHPVTQTEWNAFLQSQSWFMGDYLERICPMMQEHGVVVATYALTLNPLPLKHQRRNFRRRRIITPSTNPWLFNQLFIPTLAYVPGSDRAPIDRAFFDSYVRWQETSSKPQR